MSTIKKAWVTTGGWPLSTLSMSSEDTSAPHRKIQVNEVSFPADTQANHTVSLVNLTEDDLLTVYYTLQAHLHDVGLL